MSVILVVEQDTAYAQRITSVLSAAGHPTEMLPSLEDASLRPDAPKLVFASGTLPGSPKLLGQFSKGRGGPGSVVILPASVAGQADPGQYHADRVLPKPFSDDELLEIVGHLVLQGPDAGLAGGQLTSQDIFGDVLAEVEAEVQTSETRRRRSRNDHSDIDRKLEETLSGFFPDKLTGAAPDVEKPAAPKAKRRRDVPSADEIEDLLDKTLSSLELPARARRQKGTRAAPQAPVSEPTPRATVPAEQPPQPAAPAPPAPAMPPAIAPAPQPSAQAPPPAPPAQVEAPTATAPEAPGTPSTAFAPGQPVTELEPAQGWSIQSFDDTAPLTSTARTTGKAVAEPAGEAPVPPSPWGGSTFAPEPAQPKGFTLGDQPPPPLADPSHPTSFAPDGPEPAFTDVETAPAGTPEDTPFAPPAFGRDASSSEALGTVPIAPPSFDTPAADTPAAPPSGEPVADFAPPSFDLSAADAPPTPSFESPPELDALPELDAPTPFNPPAFDAPAGPTFASSASKAPKAFSLSDEEPLATPEYPSSFAPPETAPPPSPAPPEAAEMSLPSFTTPEAEPPQGFSPPEPVEEPPPSFDVASTPQHPLDQPAQSFDAGSFSDPPPFEPAQRDPGFGDPATPSPADGPPTFDSSAYMLESFAPAEAEEEPPAPSLPDPFAASRHGQDQPADFVSAFSMPSRETGEESSDRLQEALDGVLQIRGEHEGPAPTAPQDGTPFGDYRLLKRVAVGGMAEVWQARRRGVEGFQKTVAIKKILSHLTGSSDFVTMFIDEAKLAAQLNHANIIQIYDLGKVDDDFFIAMELVDGKDLRSILNRSADVNRPIPTGLALTIVAALARALDYAHRKRDFDNRALGLVHRDVSPQNVLISYEGEIKLCDFGIVKAVAKASTTQMGALKGKLQYMSPEQAWGKEVDARSDIFSLGSVLFEVLTGERLFTGDSEIGVLDAVRDCRVRTPRSIVPDLPPEVDRIALKALAKTPEERYQTAGELERDILSVLETLKPSPGQGDLAAYLESLFRSGPGEPVAEAVPSEPPAVAPPRQPDQAPAAKVPAPSAQQTAGKTKGKGGNAKLFLILAIILAALATIGFILYETLGSGSTSPTAPASTAPPSTQVEPGTERGAAPAGNEGQVGAPAAEDGAATQDGAAQDGAAQDGAEPLDMKGMVDEALASERKRLEADFEAERQRLQRELEKVQESSRQEGESGGSSSN